MKKTLVIALSIVTLLFLVGTTLGEDDHNPIVKIYDSAFTTETDYFPTCPVTVGIKTYSRAGPYDVIVVEPDGVTEHIIATGQSANAWHQFTYTCSKTGWWTAKAGSTTIPFGCGTFHVIPDLPIGTILAMIASLGVLSGLATSKRLRLRL